MRTMDRQESQSLGHNHGRKRTNSFSRMEQHYNGTTLQTQEFGGDTTQRITQHFLVNIR